MKAKGAFSTGILNSLSQFAAIGALSLAGWVNANAKGLPPKAAIVQPAEGDTFTAPATIHVMAQATDEDGFVKTVEFFANDHSLGVTVNNPEIVGALNPFQIGWSPVFAGEYALRA